MPQKKRHLIALTLLILTACANQKMLDHPPVDQPKPPAPVAPATQASVSLTSALLPFFAHYISLDAEAQKQRYAQINQQLKLDPDNVEARIKLAGLLALPSSYLRDSARAQLQLQGLLQEPSLADEDAALVAILYDYTQDNNKQQQKLKDEIKKNEGLQQKLIDIKNIEKTMIERNTTLDKK